MSKIIGIQITPLDNEKWINNVRQVWPWHLWLCEYNKEFKGFYSISHVLKHHNWFDETLRNEAIRDIKGKTGDSYKIFRYSKLFKKRIFVPSYLCCECGRSYFPETPTKGYIAEDCKCGSNQWLKFGISESALEELFKIV